MLRLFFLFAVQTLQQHVDAKILQGQLVTDKNWAFLARFCFLSEVGRFRYNLTIGGELEQKSKLNLLLYYDEPDQWASVYPSNRSCNSKESILDLRHGQIVPLAWTGFASVGCTYGIGNGTRARCASYREFRSSRPRWWFIVIADCISMTGLNVTYWISLTNASPDNFWRQHFSADEFYILPELIAAVCIYVILLGCTIYTMIQLRLRRLLHLSYKIFVASVVCQLSGISFEIYGLTRRGMSGRDSPDAMLVGGLLEAYSETLFAVLMLLMALGYTVTKSELTRRQTMWLLVFSGTSILLQMSLFVYQSEVFDPGLVLYIYESPPGYALLALKVFTWLVFVSCCFRTNRKITSKNRFYGALLSLGSAWFLCHPFTVLMVTILVEKWVRESVAKGCSLWIIVLGHAMFLRLTRPSSANVHFPFHIRTCQVVPATGTGQNHSYEPRSRANTASLFTISRS